MYGRNKSFNLGSRNLPFRLATSVNIWSNFFTTFGFDGDVMHVAFHVAYVEWHREIDVELQSEGNVA